MPFSFLGITSPTAYICFGTGTLLPSIKDAPILASLKKVINVYQMQGMQVRLLLGDGQFESMQEKLANMRVDLNTTAEDEHIGNIERYIRTTKERTRCIYNTLLFQLIQQRLVIEMVLSSVFWLNAFPHALGILTHMSPREIVTGQKIDFHCHC